jgi:hypothetical protein
MGDLTFDLADALTQAGEIFNDLSGVAVIAIGVGLGFTVVRMVIGMVRR